MAGKVRYLIQRDGRYHARIVVPAPLRKWVGKVELSAALGPDRKKAIRELPKVIAGFQEEIAAAARRAVPETHSTSPAALNSAWTPIGAARQAALAPGEKEISADLDRAIRLIDGVRRKLQTHAYRSAWVERKAGWI
jgi:hypothetical protein